MTLWRVIYEGIGEGLAVPVFLFVTFVLCRWRNLPSACRAWWDRMLEVPPSTDARRILEEINRTDRTRGAL